MQASAKVYVFYNLTEVVTLFVYMHFPIITSLSVAGLQAEAQVSQDLPCAPVSCKDM